LNPIENEAVVAALIKKYGDSIQVLPVGLPGFTFQKGLEHWDVMVLDKKNKEEPLTTYNSLSEAPQNV